MISAARSHCHTRLSLQYDDVRQDKESPDFGAPLPSAAAHQFYWAELTRKNDSFAYLVQAFDHEEEGVSLRSILESDAVTKLMCDCRMDSDALYHQFGIACRNVLDLQIAEVAFRRCVPATAFSAASPGRCVRTHERTWPCRLLKLAFWQRECPFSLGSWPLRRHHA